MSDLFTETWIKIINEDQKHQRETGWSYFNPQEEGDDKNVDCQS